jgi:hypothetical protein
MYWAIASFIAFLIALILDLFGVSHGHVNYTTFALIGLLCAAAALVTITPEALPPVDAGSPFHRAVSQAADGGHALILADPGSGHGADARDCHPAGAPRGPASG